MKDQKRQKILEIANRLFNEKGFQDTTTREIAEASGISNAALYYYFENKEDLFYRILYDIISKGLAKIREVEEMHPEPLEKLLTFIDVFINHFAIRPDRTKLLGQDQKCLTPEHNKVLNDMREEYVEILTGILAELKKKKQIINADLNVCSFAFFGMVVWTYRWYNPEGKVKVKEFAEIVKQIFTRGILVNPLP